MLWVCRPTFGSGKAVVLYSGFFIAKGIIDIEYKGVYAEDLIKKRHYWPNGVHGELIDNLLKR